MYNIVTYSCVFISRSLASGSLGNK